MPYSMKMAGGARGGGLLSSMFSSAASGEGLMCFFEGPGQLWLASHKPPEAADGGGKQGGGGGGGGRRQGGSPLAGICCCLLLLLLLGGGAIGAFVVVPAMGGRWVRSPYDGSYTLKWDGQPPPSPRRSRIEHGRPDYQAPVHGRGRGETDEL